MPAVVSTHGERKFVSLLFADLSGYTALVATLDPEDVYRFLRPGILELQRIVEDHGGTVPQVMGDGFMAVFGVPVVHEDDAERAVRAALAVRDHVDALNSGDHDLRFPAVHAGVNSGEVMVVPAEELAGFAVLGDVVNTASRLADLAPGGTVLVDEGTRNRTVSAIEYGPRRTRHAKGKRDLITFEALRTLEPTDQVGGPWASPDFVDREAALDRLRMELQQAVATRRGRVVLVTGEPGAGKSRLAREFARHDPSVLVLHGRCQPFGQRLPLHPLAACVRSAIGAEAGASPAELERVIDRHARNVKPAAGRATVARQLRVLLGGTKLVRGPSRTSVRDLAMAAKAIVEQLARERPVVVVVDDVQWADEDLRTLLQDLPRSPWRGPILVVALGRSDARLRGVPMFDLDPMDGPSMEAVVRGILRSSVERDLVRQTLARAEGNPLFLEETIGMLVEAGALVRGRTGWKVADPERLRTVPATIRPLIGARLDGLPAIEKRVLQDAAVGGEATWDHLIAHMSDVPDPERYIRSLERRGLLRRRKESRVPGALEYQIKHGLIRDVAYDQLPKTERSRRHLVIADWLRSRHERRSTEPVATIAHHYERAWHLSKSRTGPHPSPRVADRAVRYLLRWADQVIVYQARAAESLYQRALAVARESSEHVDARLVARTLVGLAECLIEMGRHDEAAAAASEARSIAGVLGDVRVEARSFLVTGRLNSDLGRIRRARAALDQALERFRQAGDVRGQAWVHHRLSETWSRQDFRLELRYLREAHQLFVRARDPWGRSIVAQDLAFLLTTHGGAEFDRWYSEAWRLVQDEGDVRSRAALLRTRGYELFYRGENEEAIRVMREARPLSVEAGDVYTEVDTLLIEGSALCSTSAPEQVEALARNALDVARRLRSARLEALALLLGARSALRSGKLEQSGRRLAKAAAILRRPDMRVERVELHLATALIRLEAGAFQGAASAARRMSSMAEANGWELWRSFGPMLEGRSNLGAGLHRDANRSLGEAVQRAGSSGPTGTRALAATLRVQATLLLGLDAEDIEAEPTSDLDLRATTAENDGLRALLTGELDRAVDAFQLATDARSTLGTTAWLARTLALGAEAFRRRGDRQQARRHERRAESVVRNLAVPAAAQVPLLRPLGS